MAVCAGSLIARKNCLSVVRAVRNVDAPNLVAIFVGGGVLEAELRRAAHGDPRIRFTGHVNDVARYLQAADFFVSASRSEGMPSAVLEAIACGLPLVLSDIEPHRELLDLIPSAGTLVALQDDGALAAALQRAASVPETGPKHALAIQAAEGLARNNCRGAIRNSIGVWLPCRATSRLRTNRGRHSMPQTRLERGLASLLDAAPGVRRLAKSGYQRINYLLRGGRGDCLRLHPDVSIERIGAGTAELDAAQQYFFGYFGVSPWSPDGNRYLFHRWLQGRPTIDICVHHRGESVPRVLGTSRTWNFQQGSMTQWLPQAGGAAAIVFNDCRERRLCCRILTADGHERSFDWPIQAVHPHGTQALSLNYLRLGRVQPEYGYDVVADNFSAELPVDQDGLWRVDLQSGASGLLVSLQDLEEHAPRADMGEAEHQVNHAVYSPGGKRIVFMHRSARTAG